MPKLASMTNLATHALAPAPMHFVAVAAVFIAEHSAKAL